MILYNVTINIEQTVEIQWLDWMKRKHIKDVLDTNCFISARFSRLASHTEPNSTNYVVQFLCDSDEKLKEYQSIYAANLKKEGKELFGDKLQTFRTELEVIEDFFPNQS